LLAILPTSYDRGIKKTLSGTFSKILEKKEKHFQKN